MKLSKILAISGAPGLHKYVAQGRGGIIVESLIDGKRTIISGSAKVSTLGDIAIFSTNGEVPLADILTSIFNINKGKEEVVGNKSTNEQVKAFFTSVLPDFDQERVHMSDVKKIANWYNILLKAGVKVFTNDDPADVANDEVVGVDSAEDGAKKLVAKKPTAKKTTTASKPGAPKASGAKNKAPKSANIRKSQ